MEISGIGVTELGFVIAGTTIRAEDVAATRTTRLPLLDSLRYRFGGALRSRGGALIVPADAEFPLERLDALSRAADRENAVDLLSYAQEADLGALAYAMVGIERSILESHAPDFDKLQRLIANILPTLVPETAFFDYFVGVRSRILHDHPIIHRHYVGILRTALLSCHIGRFLGLESAGLAELFTAGLLADLGMIFIPPAILVERYIGEHDFEKIRQHPVLSLRLLARHGHFHPRVLLGVYGHQRNLDGTGYPEDPERPNLLARIVNIASAVTSIIWRGQAVETAIHAIEISARRVAADGNVLRPKYDAQVVAALSRAWRVEAEQAQAQIALTKLKDGGATYRCVVFDNLAQLLFFLEQLGELDMLALKLEPILQTYIDQGRRGDQDLKGLQAMVLQLGSYPRAMGISQTTDFEDFFSDNSALRDIEKESYAVLLEMKHVNNQLGRVVDRLAHRYVDSAFREILDTYQHIERCFQTAADLVKHPPPSGA